MYKPKLMGCVWCHATFIARAEKDEDALLRAHVLGPCQGHPMRQLEKRVETLKRRLKRKPIRASIGRKRPRR